MRKRNLPFRYSLFLLVFGFLFFNISNLAAQNNKVGAYSYTVKDGPTFQLYIYEDGGETYGRLRVEGDETWEINLWSLVNGDYVDFYYELDIDNPLFTQDTHMMTLSGAKDKPLSVFGKELKAKITNLKPADLLKWEGEKPTFKIKDRAKSQTLEVKGEKKN